MKPIRVIDPLAPAGHAEVSCQVFTGKLDNCFLVAADPPSLGAFALKRSEDFAPGDLPLGLRFTLPLIYSAETAPAPK